MKRTFDIYWIERGPLAWWNGGIGYVAVPSGHGPPLPESRLIVRDQYLGPKCQTTRRAPGYEIRKAWAHGDALIVAVDPGDLR